MTLRIATNVAAINAHRTLAGTQGALARSLERLSSGLRINRAADDAAGLSISEALRAQVRGGHQAARNIQDAISALKVADGALKEATAIVQRMRELGVQAAHGVYTPAERQALQLEFAALKREIQNIAANTTFNDFPLLSGAGDDYVTSPVRTATAVVSPLADSFVVDQRQDLLAVTPRTNVANSFTVDQRENFFAVTPATTSVTISANAEQYGLGTAGPQSIVVTLRDTGTGATRTVPYDPANGFTYDAATRQITLNGTAAPAVGENELEVDFIPVGANNFNLSGTPLAGSLTVDANGVPVAADAANGYSLTGTTLRLNGNARASAGVPKTVDANFQIATTAVTLAVPAEQYGLGAGPPTSIRVTLRNTGTGATRTVPYDPANGFTYDAATRQIRFNGTGIPTGGENQVQVDYIRQGATNFALSGTPVPGTETIATNGTPVAADAANGYTITGSTLRLNGTSRPDAGTPMTVTADYLPQGTTTIPLDNSNPYFFGVLLNEGSLTFTVDGVPQTFVEGVDYTISATQSDSAGLTPLYDYELVFANATIVAAASTGAPTIEVGYTVDYPTTYGPFPLDIQSGANEGQVHAIGLDRINIDALGIVDSDISTQNGAADALAELDGALARLARIRGRYGADLNRLEYTLNNVTNQALQLETAHSRIRDADMAATMGALTRNQILTESGTQMLREANVAPTVVLSLVTGQA